MAASNTGEADGGGRLPAPRTLPCWSQTLPDALRWVCFSVRAGMLAPESGGAPGHSGSFGLTRIGETGKRRPSSQLSQDVDVLRTPASVPQRKPGAPAPVSCGGRPEPGSGMPAGAWPVALRNITTRSFKAGRRSELEGPSVSLGPSSEIDDECHEQNDDQKTDQSVAGSSDRKHIDLRCDRHQESSLLGCVAGSVPASEPSQTQGSNRALRSSGDCGRPRVRARRYPASQRSLPRTTRRRRRGRP